MSKAIQLKKKQLANAKAKLIYKKSILEITEEDKKSKIEGEIKRLEYKISKIELQLMKPERINKRYEAYKKRYEAKKGKSKPRNKDFESQSADKIYKEESHDLFDSEQSPMDDSSNNTGKDVKKEKSFLDAFFGDE